MTSGHICATSESTLNCVDVIMALEKLLFGPITGSIQCAACKGIQAYGSKPWYSWIMTQYERHLWINILLWVVFLKCLLMTVGQRSCHDIKANSIKRTCKTYMLGACFVPSLNLLVYVMLVWDFNFLGNEIVVLLLVLIQHGWTIF